MGNGALTDDPKLCYNAAKSWQLGWYHERRQSLDFTSSRGLFIGQLVGVDNYQDTNENGKYVNLQIVHPSSEALYVGFNLATGINADTVEAQNQVTVQKQNGTANPI